MKPLSERIVGRFVFERFALPLIALQTMRKFVSSICFGVGSVWAAAGVMKMLFGVRLSLPLLPSIGLEQVSVVPSIAIAIGLFGVGALLGRAAKNEQEAALGAATTRELLNEPNHERPTEAARDFSELLKTPV